MYICMCVCMYVCMYVCMFVCTVMQLNFLQGNIKMELGKPQLQSKANLRTAHRPLGHEVVDHLPGLLKGLLALHHGLQRSQVTVQRLVHLRNGQSHKGLLEVGRGEGACLNVAILLRARAAAQYPQPHKVGGGKTTHNQPLQHTKSGFALPTVHVSKNQ